MKYINAIKYKNNREHETGDETGDEIKDNAIMKFEVYECARGIDYIVQKTCGNEAERHHLESLGFVEGASVCILSAFFGYYVVRIKDSKIGIGKDLAKMIIVQAE